MSEQKSWIGAYAPAVSLVLLLVAGAATGWYLVSKKAPTTYALVFSEIPTPQNQGEALSTGLEPSEAYNVFLEATRNVNVSEIAEAVSIVVAKHGALPRGSQLSDIEYASSIIQTDFNLTDTGSRYIRIDINDVKKAGVGTASVSAIYALINTSFRSELALMAKDKKDFVAQYEQGALFKANMSQIQITGLKSAYEYNRNWLAKHEKFKDAPLLKFTHVKMGKIKKAKQGSV